MIQIPLKKKYRSAHKGRYKGGERPAPKKRRNKIGGMAHERLFGKPPVHVLRVNGLTGKSVMERV